MSPKKRLFSATKPTNKLTIGNYLGAIKNWLRFQEDYNCLFSVVDLHALTTALTSAQKPAELTESTYYVYSAYLAAGLDPQKSIIFVQSHVPAHAELGWLLNCYSTMGELSRMTQFKDKSGGGLQGHNKTIEGGLFTYPTLMASDILLYETEMVPVGDDQKQHIELTRDIAQRFNQMLGSDVLKLPKWFIPEVGGRIMDLQNPEKKMSKSNPNPKGALYLTDTDKQWSKKVKSAVTDSATVVDLENMSPGLENLFAIKACLEERDLKEVQTEYSGSQYGRVKVDVAETVVAHLSPMRKKIEDFMADKGELQRMMREGAARASELSGPIKEKIFKAQGLVAL